MLEAFQSPADTPAADHPEGLAAPAAGLPRAVMLDPLVQALTRAVARQEQRDGAAPERKA